MSAYSKQLGKRSWVKIFKSLRLRKKIRATKSNGFTLDDLLSRITDGNKHGRVDYGSAVGKELI